MAVSDQNPKLAVLCTLSAMALFGLIDNFMRLAAETGGLWQFHFLRSLIALGILGVLAAFMKIGLRPKRPALVLGRTFFATVAMLIYFGCLGIMPIAQAVAGLFTAPIFVVIFSVLFFGETVGLRRSAAVIIGFVGIVLVLRPDMQSLSLWTFAPMIAGAFHAMGIITTRRWCDGEGTLSLLAMFFGFMLVIGGVGMILIGHFVTDVPAGADGFVFRGWVPFEGTFMILTLIQGVGSLIGVGLIIKSYQLGEASFVAVFENSMIVFATLWAIALWREVPDGVGAIGLLLIVASGIIISLRTGQVEAAV
ncbi:DMT family transporter [Loktanella sp. F6476L]|uniref:DMT family transporter n=1 Tax=Loktanella sp. F6476L TaxID=2926405 RepID=UPI001FF215F6|nr:DMT family transporter [Loktanella sp. F6476L]MCK0120086.1 DMT family transporter [Loktanella sp. F6476L]